MLAYAAFLVLIAKRARNSGSRYQAVNTQVPSAWA